MDTPLPTATFCKRVTTTLERGAEGKAYYRAISDLPSCPEAGARLLRAQWQQPPTDTTALRLLGEVTPRLRDRQVFDEALSVFRDQGRSRDVRLASLEALMGYYEPGLGVKFTEPHAAVQNGSAYVMVGRGEPTTYDGPTPLTADARGKILQVLQQVSAQDSDERVRLISGYIHSRLSGLR